MGYRLLSFLLLAGGTASRPPDYRWEEPLPESFHQVLAGDMIALSYGYTTRNDITEEVKVELSHHVLSNNYENVLIAANINPLNLQPEVIYDRIPGRVIINATDHRFTFILPNVTPNESGRYWADVTFSTGTNLDHMTDVTIYQRPSFKQAPSKEVVINENGTATFEWSQTKSDAIPEVETVRVTYQNYTLVNQRKLSDTGQWMITYPDVYGTFKNRISYAASPNLDHISITVCGLRIGDSGLYTLEIIYTPRMVTLTNATTLVVTPGYKWAVSPKETSFLVAQRKNHLEFKADIQSNDNTSLKYSLFKLDQSVEVLLADVDVNGGISNHHTESLRRNWDVESKAASTGFIITISDPTNTDSGHYVLKLTTGVTSVVLRHEFDLIVLDEADLTPIIRRTSENSTSVCISVRVNNTAPIPDIVVYIGNDTHPTNGSGMVVYARMKTSQLEMCVARRAQLDLVFSSVLLYETTAAVVMIQRDISITSQHITPDCLPDIPRAESGSTTDSGNSDDGLPQQQTVKILVIVLISSVIVLTILLFVIAMSRSTILICLGKCKRNKEIHVSPDSSIVDVDKCDTTNEDDPLANDMYKHEKSV